MPCSAQETLDDRSRSGIGKLSLLLLCAAFSPNSPALIGAPCMRLNKEVFSHSAFLDYGDELVGSQIRFSLVRKQSAELKAQNLALRDQFGIRGYPTVLL